MVDTKTPVHHITVTSELFSRSNAMDFDPLSLFTPAGSSISGSVEITEQPEESFDYVKIENFDTSKKIIALLLPTDVDDLVPLHIHDLPLLRMKPPGIVLTVFLKLLAPLTVHNFEPLIDTDKDADATFLEKLISPAEAKEALAWLHDKGRFSSLDQLAAVATLADLLRKTFVAQYNGWLTRLISSDLDWLSEEEQDNIRSLTALRLAENCGRTAQPEFIRHIDIPGLEKTIYLKEPSLTSDKLGLKTWGSLFILGKRLAQNTSYLSGTVLELGSGTGLVGMVSCVLGFETVLTDLPDIVPNLMDNVELNEINALTESLDWSNPKLFLDNHRNPRYTTVILSDPLYSSKHPAWIVSMINTFLEESQEARVLLQVPIRKTFEVERATLWHLLDINGYIVQEEDTEVGYDDFGETTFLFKKLHRKA